MKILALDLSTKSSGFAIYENQDLISHGCISATSNNLFNRIEKMGTELNTVLKDNKIDKAVLEDVYPEDVHNNQSVYKALVYLQGHICILLNKYNIDFSFCNASEWRRKCGIHTGRGIKRESLKLQDIKFVEDQFGIKVNDDEADAICIGFAAVGKEIKNPQNVNINEYEDFEFA